MTIKEFKEIVKNAKGRKLAYGISEPFSWRGIYAEVCFEILKEPMTKAKILQRIQQATTETFYGYKGGKYKYDENTRVNFECEYSAYTDGQYCQDLIDEIEQSQPYQDDETKLFNLIVGLK